MHFNAQKNAVLIHNFSQISLTWEGTNPGYTIVTGIVKGGTRVHAPTPCWSKSKTNGTGGGGGVGDWYIPPLHNLPLIMTFNMQKGHFDKIKLKKFPTLPLLGRFAPSLWPVVDTTVTGIAKGCTRAHAFNSCWSKSKKEMEMGGGGE